MYTDNFMYIKTWNVLNTNFTYYNKRQCSKGTTDDKDEQIRLNHILRIIEDNISEKKLDILFLQEVSYDLFVKLYEIVLNLINFD